MKRLAMLMGGLILATAACAGAGSSSAPDPATPSPVATTPAPATVAPTTSAGAPIAVRVTFDGATCTYVGPVAVPDGSTMEWTLENDPALSADGGESALWAALYVAPVVDGTTSDDVLGAGVLKTSTMAPWLLLPGVGLAEARTLWPGDAAAGRTLSTVMTRSAYYVGCLQSPQLTDKAFPARLIEVLEG